MNREIKFRAWDKERKEWLSYFELGKNGAITCYEINETQNLIIQQFTGLHDKNGKEIWEGDVVRYDIGNPLNHKIPSPQIREIGFLEGVFCLLKDEHHYEQELNTPLKNKIEYCEVIGNIYENPDLLNK